MRENLKKIVTNDKPSLNDWSLRLPGLALFFIGIYLQLNTKNENGNCDGVFSVGDFINAPGFLSLALIGFFVFLMPYVIILINIIFNLLKILKGIKNNDNSNIPNG